jgi:hypothetical protein
MKTRDFLQLLQANPEKELLFEYYDGQIVGANYHITEVKNITVDAVDCGANTDYWKETVIQLWESPLEIGKTDFMKVNKARDILNKVNRIKPIDGSSLLKFEYGNGQVHTAQWHVGNITTTDKKLVVLLQIEPADCKAKNSCGAIEAVTSGANKAATPVKCC